MANVYILKSVRSCRYYIGSTDNWGRRLAEHRRGKSRYTRNLLPVEVCLVLAYDTLLEARRAERWLKSLKDRKILERIIRDKRIEKKFV